MLNQDKISLLRIQIEDLYILNEMKI